MRDKKEKAHVLDMTQGSPARLLIRFAMPLFLGNLLQQLYNLADTAIAGNLLGDQALAEIGATAALYSLITNFAFGMNNGLALTVSRTFGAGDKKGMRRAVCWMTTLSVLTALIMTAGFLLSQDPLLRMMQVPDETFAGAKLYLTVILAGIPLTMAYNLEAGLLQAVGNSTTPLLFLLFSSVLNVGLDFLFMGPMHMGVQGAAGATILAQGISAVLGLAYIIANYRELRFGKDEFKTTEPKFIGEMFWSGLSLGLMSTIYNIGSVLLQGSINALGNVFIAAQVGGRRLAELFYLPGVALGTAIATYSSQNHGAKKPSRIKKGMITALLIYGVWWCIAMLFTFTLAPYAVRLITGSDNPEVLENALLYLRVSIPMVPPMAVLVIFRSALQGVQHPVWPLISSTLELIGKAIFAVWLVPAWGYIAVCVCEPTTWVICMVFIILAVLGCRDEFREVNGKNDETVSAAEMYTYNNISE